MTRYHPTTDQLMNLLHKLGIKTATPFLDEAYTNNDNGDCPCCSYDYNWDDPVEDDST